METLYNDGRSEMEQFDSAEELEAAMRERLMHPDVLSVTAHKVGSKMRQNGKQYTLNALGQWERVGKKRRANPNGVQR